jgi:hypothetical protein
MRAFVIFVLLICVGCKAFAQSKPDSMILTNKKIEYFFYIQSGMLVGCHECGRGKEITFSGATVHGIKLGKRARVGVGLGHDSFYGWNTLPVFGSASWDLFSKKNAFFLQFNYGRALKTWKYNPNDEYGFQRSVGKRMVNPMVGYRIHYHDASISLSVGYKFQNIMSHYQYENWIWDPNTQRNLPDPIISSEKRSINRLMISLAVGWK